LGKLYQWIDRLWGLISETVFVRFQFDLPVANLRAVQQGGRIVFVLSHGGIVEWLILSSWCRTQGFGAILVANRKRILLFAKPLYFFQVLFRHRSYADIFLDAREEGPRLMIVPSHERKRPFTPTAGERMLSEIYTRSAASSRLGFLTFVPVFIRWRKHVRGARQFSEYLLGLSSNPNVPGKLWYLLRRRMDSVVRSLGEVPLAVRESQEFGDSLEDSEAMKVAKTLRRRFLVLINQEMRVVLGPVYHSSYAVKETLLRDPELLALVDEISREEKVDRKVIVARAYANLTEISARYRFRFVEVMFVMLTWLFTRVFDGVESREEEAHEVREILKTRSVVFVPCHRSHLDYLLIPYVLFNADIVTPHIFAGINLAFWPVGYLLRLGGAFFVRRSFRGDPLYALCVRRYIAHLIRNRFNIMFFIEGTRSRSGKMLPPAYGMLKMSLETVQRKECEDLAFVPMALCYDEVPEQGSYTRELSGADKVKESAKELVRSRKIIRRNFGKVYVRMGKPISARAAVEAAHAAGLDETLMLQKTAFEICKSINDVTPITPKSIVSTVLLCHTLSSLPLETILRLSQTLARYAIWAGYPLSVDLERGFARGVEQTLRSLQRSGTLSAMETMPRSYGCEHRRRIVLNFYKNNAIHCLLTPAILVMSFFHTLRVAGAGAQGEAFRQRMIQGVLRLRNVLKFEFFFSPTPQFVAEINRNMGFFFGEDFTNRSPAEMAAALFQKFDHEDDLSVLLRLPGDLLESYQTVADYLSLHANGALERRALVQRVVKFAEGRAVQGAIAFPESISTLTYGNALLLLENLKLLKLRKDGDRTVVEPRGNPETLREWSQGIGELLQLVQERPANILHPEWRLALEEA